MPMANSAPTYLKASSSFFPMNPNFGQESGCDLVVSKKVGLGRLYDPVLIPSKGKKGGSWEKHSPHRNEVSGDLPSLLPVKTGGQDADDEVLTCTLGWRAENHGTASHKP